MIQGSRGEGALCTMMSRGRSTKVNHLLSEEQGRQMCQPRRIVGFCICDFCWSDWLPFSLRKRQVCAGPQSHLPTSKVVLKIHITRPINGAAAKADIGDVAGFGLHRVRNSNARGAGGTGRRSPASMQRKNGCVLSASHAVFLSHCASASCLASR